MSKIIDFPLVGFSYKSLLKKLPIGFFTIQVFILALLLCISGFQNLAVAKEPKGTAGKAPSAETKKEEKSPEEEKKEDKTQSNLIQIINRSLLLKKELRDLAKKPTTGELATRKEELENELAALNKSFESLATQLQEEELPQTVEPPMDWLAELKELTKPLFLAIREITDKPRKIDTLKAKIASLETQILRFEGAKKNLETITDQIGAAGIKDGAVRRAYKEQLKNLRNKYDPQLLTLQLEEAQSNLKKIQESKKSIFELVTESLGHFFKERGRNLFIALFTFFGLWWVLLKSFRILNKYPFLLSKLDPQLRKLLKTAYNIFILSICTLASLVSLYLLNDWLLLSIVIIVLIAIAWTSRQLIPQVFKELRMILNLGTVREGERIIWKGVPWKVKEIGFYATLVNTRLSGGIIKMPVGELIGHHSRPTVKNEPWFPTQINDWVLLADDTYGQVVCQTMEQVEVKCKGSLKYYSTIEFLSLKPVNLSTGFYLIIKFGLDYSIQSRICNEIPQLFEEGLKKHLKHYFEKEPPDLLSLKVKFDQADTNSLNLFILVKVDGQCAEEYFPFQRKINTALVQICNENGLAIPFAQLTVSLSEDLKKDIYPALETFPLKSPSI